MKKLLALTIAAVVLSTAGTAVAAGPALFGNSIFYTQAPPPAPKGEAPKAMPDPGVSGGAVAVALYPCVKYRDLHHVHPCAVPKIVQIADPCNRCCDPCSCCKPRCVSVMICVPPQGCCSCPPKITCSRDGRKLRLDYGKYAVDVRVKKGYIEVDYDD